MTGSKGYRLVFGVVLAVLAMRLGAQAGPLIAPNEASNITHAETPTQSSPPYFLSTLLAQTSRAQTGTVRNNTATKITVRIENTVVKIASVRSSSATSIEADTSLTAQEELPSAIVGQGQSPGGVDGCTRGLNGGNVDVGELVACFSFEPLPITETDTTSTWLSSSSQQPNPSPIPPTTSSHESAKSSSDRESSASILHASLQQECRSSTASSSEQAQVTTTDTSSRYTIDSLTRVIATSAFPPQPSATSQSIAAAMDSDPSASIGQTERTIFQNETFTILNPVSTGNTTGLVSEAPSLPSPATQDPLLPAGYGGTNATMFPGVLETVTYTTTICPSGARI